MREAVGSALLLNIVLVFIGIVSMILVGSIAYSKAYKVKNRIVNIIEKYNGKCFDDDSDPNSLGKCWKEVEDELKNMGYSSNISSGCPNLNSEDIKINNAISIEQVYPVTNFNYGHKYCVYKYSLCDKVVKEGLNIVCADDANQSHYYKVYSFMHFDIPVIGSFLEFKVSGETRQFYDTFINVIDLER